MKIEVFKNFNENYLAVAVTFVLFFLLFLLKMQEGQTSIKQVISTSEIEIASSEM